MTTSPALESHARASMKICVLRSWVVNLDIIVCTLDLLWQLCVQVHHAQLTTQSLNDGLLQPHAHNHIVATKLT